MSVLIDNTHTFDFWDYQSRRVVRSPVVGIPYVIVNGKIGISGNSILVYKGDSSNPTSFSLVNELLPGVDEDYWNVSSAIDSTGTIHIVYYDSETDQVRYTKFNTLTDLFVGGVEQLQESLINIEMPVCISIDSNDIPHVVFIATTATETGDYYPYYTNRIGGSWKSNVLVSTITTSSKTPDLAIDKDNLPCVAWGRGHVEVDRFAVGNTNNATSFTIVKEVTTTTNWSTPTIVIDSLGNHWFSTYPVFMTLYKHNYGAAWGSWTEFVSGYDSQEQVTSAADGTNIYLFYSSFGTGCNTYLINTGGSFGFEFSLSNGCSDVAIPIVKWGYWVDFDSSGLNKKDGGRIELDYVWGDDNYAFPTIIYFGGSKVAVKNKVRMIIEQH